MLLLRIIVGGTTLAQAALYLFEQENPLIWAWVFGLTAIACGVSLLAGFLTPVCGSLVCLGGITFILLMSPATDSDWLTAGYTIAVSAAVVMLGPGAFSLDARMFGRREIIIPNKSDSP